MNFPSHLLESWSAEKLDKFLEFTYDESGLYEQSGHFGKESKISVEYNDFDDFIHEAIQGRNLLSALNKYISAPSYSKEHFIESKNEVKLLVKDSMYAEDVYFKHTTKHIFNDPHLFKEIHELDLEQRSEYATRLGTLYSLSDYLESPHATIQQLLDMYDKTQLILAWSVSECNKLHSILARKHNLSILRRPTPIFKASFGRDLQTFIENNTKWRFV